MKAANYRQWIAITVILALVTGFCATNACAGEKEELLITKKEGGFLGIYPSDLNDDDREALEFTGKDGVLIEDIVSEGPAEKAGIKAADIIVRLDGKKVVSTRKLHKILAKHEPGEKIDIVIFRDGKEKSFKVELAERPETKLSLIGPCIATCLSACLSKKGGYLGVKIITLEEQLAGYFEVDSGVLVEEVEEDSPAEKAGLKAGDVIVKIGDEEIESTIDLIDAVRSEEPGTEVTIDIVRKGKKKSLSATLGETSFLGHHKRAKFKYMIDIDEDFDIEEIEAIVRDALKNIDIHIDAGRDELRESMKQLKEEMKKLKEEMKKLKKEKKPD